MLSGNAVRVPLERSWSCFETDFLRQLGDRLRATRLRRHISRRELSRRSGISERYIARIEAGTGNVSVLLLLRIARGLRGSDSHEGDALSVIGGACWENWF